MKHPLISVIVPVYKAEQYLNECVQSIIDQTYRNLEIILVDDGSPDSCPQLCDAWMKKDERIIVVHKENGGASSARNAGLDIAKGEYIGFVDSDDFISEHMYEWLEKGLSNGRALISCGQTAMVDSAGKESVKEEIYPSKDYDSKEALIDFFHGNRITSSMCDKLFAHQIFQTLRFPVGETNEEYPMWIPVLMQANGIFHTGKQVYFYRENKGSVTHLTWKTDAGIVLRHLREMEEQISKYNITETMPAFQVFSAKASYSLALHLDKHYEHINSFAKKNQREYIHIMRKNLWPAMKTETIKKKDKILYLMVVLRVLRPIYKLLGKL